VLKFISNYRDKLYVYNHIDYDNFDFTDYSSVIDIQDPYLIHCLVLFLSKKPFQFLKDIPSKNLEVLLSKITDPVVLQKIIYAGLFDDAINKLSKATILNQLIEKFSISTSLQALVATYFLRKREKSNRENCSKYDNFILKILRDLDCCTVFEIFKHLSAEDTKSFYLILPYLAVSDKLLVLQKLKNSVKISFFLKDFKDDTILISILPHVKEGLVLDMLKKHLEQFVGQDI